MASPYEVQMVLISRKQFRSILLLSIPIKGKPILNMSSIINCYGRCRGMGMGVTAIQIYPDLSRRSRTTSLRPTNSEELREIEQLKLQMSIMQKTIDRLVDARSQPDSRENSSGTSVGQGIHLSPEQFLRMMASIQRSNPDESTPNNTLTPSPTTNLNPNQGM